MFNNYSLKSSLWHLSLFSEKLLEKKPKTNGFVLTVLMMLFAVIGIQAQTQRIPAGDGNFSNGLTFAANGWTVANQGASPVKWTVGTAASGTTSVGSVTSASPNVTLTAPNAAITVGKSVYGVGIPTNTFVTAIAGTALTLSQNATVTTASATLGFGVAGGISVGTSQATTATGMAAQTYSVTLAAANPNISVGQLITGTNIASDTYVASINGTALGLSRATTNIATISSAVTLTFAATSVAITGNAAYVSNDNGLTNSYNGYSIARTVYFSRDITTIPANETAMTLTFDIKSAPVSNAGWQVWVAPTSQTVTGTDTQVTAPFTYGVSWPGATLISFNSNPQGAATKITAFIPKSFAGTSFKLIFVWTNTSSVNALPPAAIDNISLTSRMPEEILADSSGLWSLPSTWDGDKVPTPADDVVIEGSAFPGAKTIMIDSRYSGCNDLSITGANSLFQFAISATTDEFTVNGSLNISGSGARFNNHDGFTSNAGKYLKVGGNFTVGAGARFDSSIGNDDFKGRLELNGTAPQTVTFNAAATIGGTAAGTNAFDNVAGTIMNLQITNTSTAIPNVTWDADGVRIRRSLSITTGRVSVAAGKRIILGNFGNCTINVPHGYGFTSGTVSRWVSGSITTNNEPGAEYPGTSNDYSPGLYPFVSATGQSRVNYILPSASPIVAGEVAVTYTDATTVTPVTVNDGGYTIDKRYDSNWMVSTPDANAIPAGSPVIADFSSLRATTQATTATGMPATTTTVTLSSASNNSIKVGQVVTGTNIAPNTTVAAISGTTLTLSQATTNVAPITAAVTLSFLATVYTTPTGMPATSTTLTLANATSGVFYGQLVSGTDIAPGTFVTYVSGTTLTLSQPTTNVTPSSSPVLLTFSSAFRVGVYSTGAFQALNGSSRLMKSASALGGTHQEGTTTPYMQRNYISLAELTSGPIYVGAGNAATLDITGAGTITSTVSGGDRNWNTPATWVGGVVPTCSNNVVIAIGTVNVTATANAASIIINTGGTLVNNGGATTMTVGCSNNNNAFINYGTHTMTSGNLVVNGFVAHKVNSTFNQTGGEISIDGNDNGNIATSVSYGGSMCKIETGNLNLTGGKITIVDPLVNISTAPIVQNSLSDITVTTAGATGDFAGTTTGTTASGSLTIVIPNFGAGFFVPGQRVTAPAGIAPNTVINSVSVAGIGNPPAVTLTLNNATTASLASGSVVNFSSMHNGSDRVVLTQPVLDPNSNYIGVGSQVSGTGIVPGTTVIAINAQLGGYVSLQLSNAVTGLATSPITTQQTLSSPAVNVGATFTINPIVNPLIFIGQTVSGTGILPGTFVTSINDAKVNFSNPIQPGAPSPLVLTYNQGTSFASGAFVYTAAKHYAAGLNHTLQIGDGVSTQNTAAISNGFNCVFTTRQAGNFYLFSLGNLIVNAPDGDNRFMSTSNGDLNTFYGTMNVQNQLTIASGSVLKKTFGNSTWYVGGNIVNNGQLLMPSAGSPLYLGNFINGVAVPTSLPQTISGTGVFSNNQYSQNSAPTTASVGSFTVNNTSSAGVTLDVANFRAMGGVTMTNGILHTSTAKPIYAGNSDLNATSTSSYSGGNATSFIDGPAYFSIINPGNIGLLTNIPVGKGTTYLPIAVASRGTAPNGGMYCKAEAFITNSGTVNAANASNLSAQRWVLTPQNSLTLDNYNIRVGAPGVTANTVVVKATTDEGTYDVFAPQANTTNDLTAVPPTSVFNTTFTQATTATGMPALSTNITLAAANANIKVGQVVTGTNIVVSPPTTVAAISGTALTLSQATTNAAAITTAVTMTFEGRPTGATWTGTAPGNFAYAINGASCSGTPTPGATLASSTTACAGNPITLSLANTTAGSNVTYQWRSSVDGGTTWVNISGATAATYLATPTENTSYSCTVNCSSNTGVSTPVAITITASTAITTGDTTCEAGTTALAATGSATLNWYDAPTGGALVATGTNYSPTVASTTTYHVASASSSAIAVNSATPSAFFSSTTLFTGIVFNTANKTTLKSVTVYPKNTAALRAPITIGLFDSTGAIVGGTAPVTFVPNVVAAYATGSSQTVTLNYTIPAGSGYRLLVTNGVVTDNHIATTTTTITYPTTVGGVTLVGNAPSIAGAPTTVAGSTTFFNNLLFDDVCESVSRTPVVATVGCTKNLKLFIEGYYDGASTMRPVKNNQDLVSPLTDVCDVTVELRNTTAPYAIAATTTAVLKTDGTVAAKFNAFPAGNYYIAVKHRNAIETWSAAAEPFGLSTTTYDFSTAANKAYGNNMINLGGVFAFYSGDLNQDGFIEGEDYPFLQNASDALLEGDQAADLNGDGFVEGLDFPFFFNNSDALIEALRP